MLKPKTSAKSKKQALQWHPASFSALQLELEDYKKYLKFIAEYELTLMPLKIDILVVRKLRNIRIDKNFADIFKKHNLIEYKSPSDYLAVNDFYKVTSYAGLYIVKNNVSFKDLTLTFIENKSPKRFLAHLQTQHSYDVKEKYPGIYRVSGGMFPMQVLEIPKLSTDDNFYLQRLRDDINAKDADVVLDKISARTNDEIVKMYIDILSRANAEVFEEVSMKSKKTLEEVLVHMGWTKKWEARGKEIGERHGERRGISKALDLMEQGYKPCEIREMALAG